MIKIAKTAGFCMGVRRAVDIVLGLSRNARFPIYTDGPLIHNPQIVALLERKGIRSIKGIPAPTNGVVVIRAHGVSPDRRLELKGIGLPLHDATCPDVTKVQAIVKKYSHQGYTVVIVGDRGHAEVEGLLGFAGARGLIVSHEKDLETLPPMDKACVVAQTTQDTRFFEKVAGVVRSRVPECVVFDTICDSTRERQREAVSLASSVDTMIVVGGRNSANTLRLVSICEREGTPVFHVESEKELDRIDLQNIRCIGVACGASTPNWVIERVVEKLRGIQATKRRGVHRLITTVIKQLIMTRLFTAISSVFLYMAACLFQGIGIHAWAAISVGSCVLCLHLTNRLAGVGLLFHGEETLARDYYCANRRSLGILAFIAGGVSLISALLVNYSAFIAFLAVIALGLYYSFEESIWRTSRLTGASCQPPPDRGGRAGIEFLFLKMLPASREIFVSLAWMVAIVLAPRLAVPGSWTYRATAACAYVFALVFIRSTFRDVHSIQGDAIVGKETIPTLIGIRWTKLVLAVLIAAACYFPLTADVSIVLKYALVVPVPYIVFYLYFYHRLFVVGGLLWDFLADGQFVIVGLSSLLLVGKV